jgi:hypothetical protein
MVSGISSSGSIQSNYQTSTTSKLTDEQKSTLADIIAKYDPENMTDEDTKAMMDEIKEAGIGPSKEFGEIMNAAGFKPPEKPEGPPPTDDTTSSTSSSSTTSTTEVPEYLASFLEKQESGTATEDDILTLVQNLLNSNKSTTGSIVDTKA